MSPIHHILALLLILSESVSSQHITANPFVINHPRSEYKAGRENWDLLSTREGLLVSANNEGVLVYNGNQWKLHRLPNRTIVRSVEMDVDCQRIYVGGQDEFGYFEADGNGLLSYNSLTHLLPANYAHLEDVWDVTLLGANVFFRSLNSVFKYDGHSIHVCPTPPGDIQWIAEVNARLIMAHSVLGLMEWNGKSSDVLPGGDDFNSTKIIKIIPIQNKHWIIVTEKHGIFRYDGINSSRLGSSSFIQEAVITCAVKIDDYTLALGSIFKGIIFLDINGNHLFDLTTKNGLSTHSIISLVLDNNYNLWAGSSKGIDQILTNSAFSIYLPDQELAGGVYAVIRHNGYVYAGTNNGLFYSPWARDPSGLIKAEFKPVKNSSGQVWGLDVVNGTLLMSHNEGGFEVKGDRAIKISSQKTGFWRFLSLPDENRMLGAGYTGFTLFNKVGESWKEEHVYPEFKESARIIVPDKEGIFWVSHPYRGIYKVKFAQNYQFIQSIRLYGKKQGLPSDLGNYITRLNGQIYVNGERDVYYLDRESDRFLLDKNLSEALGKGTNTRRLFQKNDSDIWFDNENNFGVIKVKESPLVKSTKKITLDFIKGTLIGGFENVYIADENSVFICTEQGLIYADVQKLTQQRDIHLRFNEISCTTPEKRILFGGVGAVSNGAVVLPPHATNISFSIGSNTNDMTQSMQYSFALEGKDGKWTDWQSSGDITYNYLPYGAYKFVARARQAGGPTTRTISFSFSIARPWHATIYAISLYIILGISGLFLLIKRLEKKHEKEKKELKIEKEATQLKVDKLIEEKLQAELDFKTKELGLSTMHIVQKNETITKIREELSSIVKTTKEPHVVKLLKNTIAIVSNDQILEDDWDSFARHFDQVHTDFIKRLKDKYPQMSPKDLKLCAYLRMNLASKEIAPLLNISVRGVEISRYRLRKKMLLHAEVNLTDFMMNF